MSSVGAARAWLGIAFAATCLAGTAYGLAQQGERTAADDPQIQIAEDAARRLEAGAQPATEVPGSRVEIGQSLATWLMIYGRDGRLLASSADLDGAPVDYPVSALRTVAAGGQKHLTWAPRPSVRQATVIAGYGGGWVVAGRSLRAIEQRTATMLALALTGWTVALVGSALILLGTPRRHGQPPRSALPSQP